MSFNYHTFNHYFMRENRGS